MAAVALILLVCYGLVPSPSSSSVTGQVGWWALPWLPSLLFLVTYVWVYKEQNMLDTANTKYSHATSEEGVLHAPVADQSGRLVLAPVPEALDEGPHTKTSRVTVAACCIEQTDDSKAHLTQQPIADKRLPVVQKQRSNNTQCLWSKCTAVLCFVGWSSIPWTMGVCFFLALQAAWQAADFVRYPAANYDELVPVAIVNTEYTANVFIRCVGPDTPELSTFLLEAAEGAPAATLFGLQDQLSLGGRRSCSYDRLGLGWSDDYIQPSNLKRVPMTLKNLLKTAEPFSSKYILVGHGQGGQFALQFASMFPEKVSGLTLMNSYSATAENLDLNLIHNHTDIWGKALYRFRNKHPQRLLAHLDLLRAIAPLGWTRWLSDSHSQYTRYWYQDVVRALYGNNKASQGRWGDSNMRFRALPDSLNEQLTLLSQADGFWYGTGWKDFSPRPVLIMPAATSLASAGCGITTTACGQLLESTELPYAHMAYMPKQVLAYWATLSDNATLHSMPGDHTFPWANASGASSVLLDTFAGV